MASGFVRVATVGNVAVRVHWVAPIVWVVAGISLSRVELGFGGILAAMAIYLAHAAGHWAFALLHRLKVHRIEIDGMGASIGYSGRASRGVHAQVAFGGVLVHVVLALILTTLAGASTFAAQMLWVNFVVGSLNLLPFGRLDGAAGWRHAMAALRQPMHLPDGLDDHPAIRAQRLVADADREVGHPPSSTRRAEVPDAPSELMGGPGHPASRDIASQVDALMAEARADAKARRSAATDEGSD